MTKLMVKCQFTASPVTMSSGKTQIYIPWSVVRSRTTTWQAKVALLYWFDDGFIWQIPFMKPDQIFGFVIRSCDSCVELPCKDYRDKLALNDNIRLRSIRDHDKQCCVLILLTSLESAWSGTSNSWLWYRPCLSDHREQLYLFWSSWMLRTLVMLNVPSEFTRLVVVELEVMFLS